MKLLIIPFCLLVSLVSFGQVHWESIILSDHVFNYYPATNEPDSNWNKISFDATTWPQGKGGFGYGDNDDTTVINSVNSVYLRKTFTISDLNSIATFLLFVDYDDAFVAYLNGKEIARSSNLTEANPTYNSTLTSGHEAGTRERFELSLNDFVDGENLLAVQVINHKISSSDLSSNVSLLAEVNSAEITYYPTPDWYVEPVVFTTSNLPIVLIDTNGGTIIDDPKIVADMKITNTTDGSRNSVEGPFTEYDGKIAIELRGETTLGKDKKSYRLETQLENGDNNNVSIFGMPEENDWILYGPYVDKTFLRNDIAFHTCDVLGQYATRRQFCELVINGEYLGVYIFLEKIKIDDNRVNIAKLKEEDIAGDELTGGYIFRSDKSESGYPYFSTGVDFNGVTITRFQFYDPKIDELSQVQEDYLINYIAEFERALVGTNFDNPNIGYNNYVNVGSFIDYLISSEVTLEQDRFWSSTYFHKEKDSNGGKIYAGPIWDNNYGFGSSKSFDYIQNADIWHHEYEINRVYWWRRMMQDPYFEDLFYTRWTTKREAELSDENLMKYIDSMATYLHESQVRNFNKWPIQGQYVFPNKFTGATYQEDVDYLKNWILDRCEWIDSNITGALIEPTVAIEVEGNYLDKESFGIEIELNSDYFNRKTFKNKHFKLNNEGAVFSKDTILFVDASTALLKVNSSVPGTRLPDEFSVTVYEKVINSFTDLESKTYGAILTTDSSFSAKENIKVYSSNGTIIIKCLQPEYLGEELEIFNLFGAKLTTDRLEAKYTNRITMPNHKGFAVIRLMYKGVPYSIKLVLK